MCNNNVIVKYVLVVNFSFRDGASTVFTIVKDILCATFTNANVAWSKRCQKSNMT